MNEQTMITYERDGKKRSHAMPSREQLLDEFNAVCPPEICPNNPHFAAATFSAMYKAMRAGQMPEAAPDAAPPKHGLAKVGSYVVAKAGPRVDDIVAAKRLEPCRHGGVFCPKCRKWTGHNESHDAWLCDCGWSIGTAEAIAAGAAPCPFWEKNDRGEFCTQCGCGNGPDAELTVKTTMLKAKCPRDLWPKE